MSFIKLSCILIDFKNLLLILDQLDSIVDRLARINKTFNRFSSESLILLLILFSLSTIDSSWSRINSKFLKSIRIQESLILASLSTISMSHMQDVILEKMRSGRYYCLFLPIISATARLF